MTVSLTCACGAHLEIDEKFAGQQITCPDCGRGLKAPGAQRGQVRTSGLALSSLLFALVGAFTVVGTALAMVLGVLGLRSIARRPEKLAGRGFALAGIVLGAAFTALTLFAYANVELFGLDSLLRHPEWAGKLDYTGPLEIGSPDKKFSITRPSRQWGVLLHNPLTLLPIADDLILVNVKDDAHIVCLHAFLDRDEDMETCIDLAVQKFRESDLLQILNRGQVGLPAVEVRSREVLPKEGSLQAAEVLLDTKVDGRERTFLLRVVRPQNAFKVRAVAAGARKPRFPRLEPELRKAVESYRAEP